MLPISASYGVLRRSVVTTSPQSSVSPRSFVCGGVRREVRGAVFSYVLGAPHVVDLIQSRSSRLISYGVWRLVSSGMTRSLRVQVPNVSSFVRKLHKPPLSRLPPSTYRPPKRQLELELDDCLDMTGAASWLVLRSLSMDLFSADCGRGGDSVVVGVGGRLEAG